MGSNWSIANQMCLQASSQSQKKTQQKAWDMLSAYTPG